ncbi:MAG: cytochrome c family protein, partial [Verrucomicrobiae bacterium]|nr:cytochrome c family protein [Verrucomicrobiae bacterium]
MNHPSNPRRRMTLTALVATLAMTTALGAEGEPKEMYKPVGTAVGGLNPRPTIHTLTEEGGSVTLGWQGLTPPYQVEGSPSAADPIWQAIGGIQAGTSATLDVASPMEIFRVRAADPIYVGAKECGRCHRDVHTQWNETGHAHALQTLANIGMDHNASCLGCHVVGLGQPSGFVSAEQTPQLGGVQCENCHGPGGNHAFNPFDEGMQPKVTLAS